MAEETGGGDPYEGLAENPRGAVVTIQGREGKVDWKHYAKRYTKHKKVKKAIKKFKRGEWESKPRMRVKGGRMSPWDYYKTVGYDEGRSIVVKNNLGKFEGIFSEEGYATLAGCRGRRGNVSP